MDFTSLFNEGKKNFVFLGEAGVGKSEIALNFARYLQKSGTKKVHFFDMDMTKPLFRSRDLADELQRSGIILHYEEQFMDAPILVGGLRRLLKDAESYVVVDVGGDYIGARSIGGFAAFLNHEKSNIYYVLNPYRPWSYDLEHIDLVLGTILGVSHIQIENLRFISNPNIGSQTEITDITEGHQKLADIISCYKPLDFICVYEKLAAGLSECFPIPVMPIQLNLRYSWA